MDDEQGKLRTLANGAIYDMERHRIVKAAPKPFITKDNAAEMQKRAVEKKRVVMARAANSAVQDSRLIAEYGDMAHVAERAITLQSLATTPEAGKAAVMAHQALVRDTGMDERLAQQAQKQEDDPLRELGLQVLEYLYLRQTAEAQGDDAILDAE